MDSELQIALVALGVVAVVGIIGYNKWQERKHRKQMETAFRGDHRDVLLEPREAPPDDDKAPPVARLEPAEAGVRAAARTKAPDAAATGREARSGASVHGGRRGAPGMPDGVDVRVDCVIRFEAIEAIDPAHLWPAQLAQLQELGKPVRWFAFDDSVNLWRALNAKSTGRFHWFCAAMQLVDRRGAISEADFNGFSGGVQRVADQFLAVPSEFPAKAQTMVAAEEIDRFCAGVDVQVGVNIVPQNHPFSGTKVRSLAESNHMTLGADGAFHACDDEGRVLFSLSNLEPELFSPTSLRTLRTHGITLLIDVPLVADGVGVFDRMMKVANQMAHSLDGVVVDDNRTVFNPESAALIRAQIEQFQRHMSAAGIPAGGALADRLFST